jgi:phosphinothricin acetyltransferase
MITLINRCMALGYHVLVARISQGNDTSVKMHEKFGFETVGVMKELGFKWGQWHGVVIMQKLLDSRPNPPDETATL